MSLGTPINQLSFSSGTDGTAFTSGSFTIPANSRAFLFVAAGHATASTEPASIVHSGGLTFTKMTNQGQASTTATLRGTWYTAVNSTGAGISGTITANFATTHSNCDMIVDTMTGVDTTTPVKQFGTPFQSTTTDNPGITLPSAITAGNAVLGANCWNRTFVLPVGTGFTQSGGTTSQTTPTIISSTEYKMAGTQLVDWTTTDDIVKVMFAIEVNAAAGNAAPSANAGPDQTGKTVGSTITLAGSASDSDGTVASTVWTHISGPTSVGALSNANVLGPTYTAPLGTATDVWRLTVTDNLGATATDDVSITTANVAPTANAGTDQSVGVSTTVTLHGSGSDPESTVSYAWSHISGPTSLGALSSATVASPTYTAPATAGTDVWRLTVTDTGGATATDDVSIAATANAAPTANAGPDQTGIEPYTTVTLAGSGSDSDGTVASKVWSKVSGPTPLGNLSSTTSYTPTYKCVPNAVTAQTDVWRLTVTDNLGAATTDDVSITMLAVTERAVIAGAEVPAEWRALT